MLLTTIGALAPTTLGDYQTPLARCLTRLSWVHDTLVAGIVGTRAPTPADGDFTQYWRASSIYWPYGAVERYSGASLVTSYFDDFDFPGRLFPLDNTRLDHFCRLVQLRIAQKKKALYNRLGFPTLRQAIDLLSRLTGEPPLANTPFDGWSLKEALGVMGMPMPAGVRPLRAVVQSVPPYATPLAVWGGRPGLPLPAGLRSLLVQLHA
jgi:hypothetical protein